MGVSTLLTYQEQSGAFVYILTVGQRRKSAAWRRWTRSIGLLQPLAQPPDQSSVCHPIYLPLVLR